MPAGQARCETHPLQGFHRSRSLTSAGSGTARPTRSRHARAWHSTEAEAPDGSHAACCVLPGLLRCPTQTVRTHRCRHSCCLCPLSQEAEAKAAAAAEVQAVVVIEAAAMEAAAK
eukprot:179460-Chlamydomonas_euryale.AAC.7